MINASEFTLEQRAELERLIRARIERLRGDVARALRGSGRADAIGLANHLEETDDAPVADLETVLEVAEIERDVRELRELHAARGRLRTPDYGVCADCGATIPFARLQASPAATRCIGCQARHERTHAAGR